MILHPELFKPNPTGKLDDEMKYILERVSEINSFMDTEFYSRHIEPLSDEEKSSVYAFIEYITFFVISASTAKTLMADPHFLKHGVYLVGDINPEGVIHGFYFDGDKQLDVFQVNKLVEIPKKLNEIDEDSFAYFYNIAYSPSLEQ